MGAKVLKDVSEFSKQNLPRLAQQQLGPVGKVSSEELRRREVEGGGKRKKKKKAVVGFCLSIKAAVNGWEVGSARRCFPSLLVLLDPWR